MANFVLPAMAAFKQQLKHDLHAHGVRVAEISAHVNTMSPLAHHQLIVCIGLVALTAWSFVQIGTRDMTWPALWSQEPAATDPILAELRHRANLSRARLVQSGQVGE